MQLCSKKLYAYGGQKLEVVGQFKSGLAVEETKVLTHFIVVKRGSAWSDIQRRQNWEFSTWVQYLTPLLRAVTQSVAPLWKASKLSFQVYSVLVD